MKKGGIDGGKTITGIRFESRVTLANIFEKIPGYTISGDSIYFKGQKVAELYGKYKLYKKLLAPLEISIKYVYVLCDWFKKKEYKDTLDYIKSVGCYYFFEELPLDFLGLPKPT